VNLSFKLKLYFTFVFYGIILVSIGTSIIYMINQQSIKTQIIQELPNAAAIKEERFKKYLEDFENTITALEKSTLFQRYLEGNYSKEDLEKIFLTLSKSSSNIMQLRFLDLKGMEVIRIDRDRMGEAPKITPQEALQNKEHRYYFQRILETPKDKFWYSNLDLNVEHGKIEVPLKPVIRIGRTLYSQGQKVGMVIINIFVQDFLKALVKSINYEIYLIDQDGEILVEPSLKFCWLAYLDKEVKNPWPFADKLQHIVSNKEYKGSNFYSKELFLQTQRRIKIIVMPKPEYLKEKNSAKFLELILVLLGIIILSIPLSYLFALTPASLQQKLAHEKHKQDILLSLFDISSNVLFRWDSDANYTARYVSKSVNKLLECSGDAFLSGEVNYYEDCIFDEDRQQVYDEIQQAIEERVYFFKHQPYRIRSKKGAIKWVLVYTVIIRDFHGEIKNFLGYLNDITELKNQELLLEKLSRTDQLTKVHNRLSLDEILQNQYERYQRGKEPFSIAMVDIDHFKKINDQFGHLVGDRFLIEFTRLIQDNIRSIDFLGRWGGEEFLIIFPYKTADEAYYITEKLRKLIANHTFKNVGYKTASFGIAQYKEGISIEAFVEEADQKLYLAKAQGRDRVVYQESCDL